MSPQIRLEVSPGLLKQTPDLLLLKHLEMVRLPVTNCLLRSPQNQLEISKQSQIVANSTAALWLVIALQMSTWCICGGRNINCSHYVRVTGLVKREWWWTHNCQMARSLTQSCCVTSGCVNKQQFAMSVWRSQLVPAAPCGQSKLLAISVNNSRCYNCRNYLEFLYACAYEFTWIERTCVCVPAYGCVCVAIILCVADVSWKFSSKCGERTPRAVLWGIYRAPGVTALSNAVTH